MTARGRCQLEASCDESSPEGRISQSLRIRYLPTSYHLAELPKEIKATATAEKGKAPALMLESADKELLGLVAAKIRSLRKPDVYKGKGVRFAGEQLRIKPGKAAAGAGGAK